MKNCEFFQEFYKKLKYFYELNNRDVSEFDFKENKSNVNILLKNDIMIQFRSGSAWLKLNKQSLLDKYGILYSRAGGKQSTIPLKISISNAGFINNNAEFFIDLFDNMYLKNNSNAFSFCSKWAQCGDALRCVETDMAQASLCRCRKNIERGLVFNGKNSVLDNDGKINSTKVQANLAKMSRRKITKIPLFLSK